MHQALYRKWRPTSFDDVYGQDHITSILKYEVANAKLSHAYLFCGSRGTGKTTCAKILAKAVNCESPIQGNPCCKCPSCLAIENGTTADVTEMDAASNNGVDNVRDIRDEVNFAPANVKYRVYIVDEVHMLSPSAFNALLKTLEEPPEHVIFILATTEMQKLPSTIISRCQRFEFRRIATEALVKRLSVIAKEEKIELTDGAALTLAKLAQGGMRDAISLLELTSGGGARVTEEHVRSVLGIIGREQMLASVHAILQRDFDFLYRQIDDIVASAKDLAVFWQDLLSVYRDLLVIQCSEQAKTYLDLTEDEYREMKQIASSVSSEILLYQIAVLEDAFVTMQKSTSLKRITAEVTFAKLCKDNLNTSVEALLCRIQKLEEQRFTPVQTIAEVKIEKPIEVETPKVSAKTEIPPIPSAQPEIHQVEETSFDEWQDVLDGIRDKEAQLYSFLKDAVCRLTGDGKVILEFSNDFSKMMVDNARNKETIRMALSGILRREVTDSQLVMTSAPAKKEKTINDLFHI